MKVIARSSRLNRTERYRERTRRKSARNLLLCRWETVTYRLPFLLQRRNSSRSCGRNLQCPGRSRGIRRPAAIQFWMARTQTLKIWATCWLVYIGLSGRFWSAKRASSSGYFGRSELLILFSHSARLDTLQVRRTLERVDGPVMNLETVDFFRCRAICLVALVH